jgi:hypothetical protein
MIFINDFGSEEFSFETCIALLKEVKYGQENKKPSFDFVQTGF